MLLIDGVKYKVWTPGTEDEFEREVKKHTQEIFGEQSIFLDRKQKLKSLSGIGSIPDGYVIILEDAPNWHIVEVELSSHLPHDHVVTQLNRFTLGIRNPSTQNNLVKAIYEYISGDGFLTLKLKKETNCIDIHKFLADLIFKPPVLTVIIEKKTKELEEALGIFRREYQTEIVEFQTFTREGIGLGVHAHLFEPLYQVITPKVTVVSEQGEVTAAPTPQDILEVIIRTPSFIKFNLFAIPKDRRSFFPKYEVPFILETDIGEIETYMTSRTPSNPEGAYFTKNMTQWYRRHPTIKVGDKVIFTVIEPLKRYHLELLK